MTLPALWRRFTKTNTSARPEFGCAPGMTSRALMSDPSQRANYSIFEADQTSAMEFLAIPHWPSALCISLRGFSPVFQHTGPRPERPPAIGGDRGAERSIRVWPVRMEAATRRMSDQWVRISATLMRPAIRGSSEG